MRVLLVEQDASLADSMKRLVERWGHRAEGCIGGKDALRKFKTCPYDLVLMEVGLPDMKGKVFDAVIVRQKQPYRRYTGERICFEDNAAVLLKDDKGNPKGTQVKGPVAKEIAERWSSVSKIAKFVL